MNKFCHTGFSQIQELYNQHVEQIDSALQHCKETPCTNGMAGEPIPYQLRNDFAVTGIVFLCQCYCSRYCNVHGFRFCSDCCWSTSNVNCNAPCLHFCYHGFYYSLC